MQSHLSRPGGGTIAAGNRNRWKIEVASQMRFGIVFGAFWVVRRLFPYSPWGHPLATIFVQKEKNTKKKSIRSSGTVPERSKNAKKTIFERLGKRLVFWMVFSLKMAYFWRPFSMKKPSKNPCWFWTRKSHDFWWKINAKTAWVFALFFYFFCSFSKSA